MPIDLIYCSPDELAESASLDDLLKTARSIEHWENRHAEVLDFVYRHRLTRLIRRGASLDELRALNDHIARVTHPRRLVALNALDRRYGDHWLAYRDILETRIAALSSDAPVRLLERAHVKEILQLVLDGGARRQQDIARELGLKKANLTRVLKMMDANELIVRRKEGREVLIEPGPNAERLLALVWAARPKQRRWASMLSTG